MRAIIVNLKDFIHDAYPQPFSSSPINQELGAQLHKAFREFAINFYRSTTKTNLNEWEILKALKRKAPNESEEKYTYALERGRLIFAAFKRAYRQGIIHGVPPCRRDIKITNNIIVRMRPTLVTPSKPSLCILLSQKK